MLLLVNTFGNTYEIAQEIVKQYDYNRITICTTDEDKAKRYDNYQFISDKQFAKLKAQERFAAQAEDTIVGTYPDNASVKYINYAICKDDLDNKNNILQMAYNTEFISSLTDYCRQHDIPLCIIAIYLSRLNYIKALKDRDMARQTRSMTASIYESRLHNLAKVADVMLDFSLTLDTKTAVTLIDQLYKSWLINNKA